MTRQKKFAYTVLLGIVILAMLFILIKVSFAKDPYTATALLRIEPPTQANKLSCDMMNRRVQNYAETILSEKVIAEVLQHGISQADLEKELPQNNPDPIAYLMHAVSVRQVPGTDFIAISLAGNDNNVITGIVNAIAEAAVKNAKSDIGNAYAEQINRIQYESKSLGTKKDDLKSVLTRLVDVNHSLIPRETLTVEQHSLVQTKVSTQMKLIAAQTRLKNLPEGNEKASLEKTLKGEIQECEAQLAWCNQEIDKNTERLNNWNSLQYEREAIQKELETVEKNIHAFDRKIIRLRMRIRGEEPLQLCQRATSPTEPS